jgi:hypothetical protein
LGEADGGRSGGKRWTNRSVTIPDPDESRGDAQDVRLALFQIDPVNVGVFAYPPASDGQRFLVTTPVGGPTPPITVVYHVVYLEPPTHMRILAVAHDRRKSRYWERRLK